MFESSNCDQSKSEYPHEETPHNIVVKNEEDFAINYEDQNEISIKTEIIEDNENNDGANDDSISDERIMLDTKLVDNIVQKILLKKTPRFEELAAETQSSTCEVENASHLAVGHNNKYHIKIETVIKEESELDEINTENVCIESAISKNNINQENSTIITHPMKDRMLNEECKQENNISLNVKTIAQNIKIGSVLSKNLKNHTKTHTDEKRYSCKLCNYKCTQNSVLTKHLRIHTGEKHFSCSLCQYKCATSVDLKRHMRTHTGEKPYSCNLCKYKCTDKGNLKKHFRTHTGDKPYSCKLCDYKCTTSVDLKRHMRVHTGEKPYSCNLCKYECTDRSNLKKHSRTHTGEKPYSCHLCEYKCTTSGYLRKHLRFNHV